VCDCVQMLVTLMPNKRKAGIRRATITLEDEWHLWALRQARHLGINNFSAFVRFLMAAEKRRQEKRPHEKAR
jgi:hypothetical protein